MRTCRSLVMLLLWCWCGVSPAIGWSSDNKVDTNAGSDGRGNLDQLKLSEEILDKLTSLEERLISLEQKMTSGDAECPCPQGPFAIRKVSRELTAEGYMVRIEYQGSEEPLVTAWSGWQGHSTSLEVQKHGGADRESRTVEILLRKLGLSLYINFELKSVSYTLRIYVAADTPTETEVTTPNIVFLPGNDVAYERGRDAEVTVLFEYDSGDGFAEKSALSWTGYTASEGKENTMYSYTSSEPLGPSIQVTSDVTSADNKERTLEIFFNTASVEKGAVFTVGMDFDLKCSGGCLVQSIHVESSLSLYPADEAGPVPPGSIGFIQDCINRKHQNSSWECLDETMPSVESTTYCGLDDSSLCKLDCHVLADPKAASVDLKMVKLGQEGETTPVDFKTYPRLGSLEYLVMTIENVSLSDAGQYRCIARTESSEADRTQTIEVVTQYARIVDFEAKVDNWTLEVRCVAEGTPAPDIKFSSPEWQLGAGSEYVTLTQLNAITTQADLRISDPAILSTVRYIVCETSNSGFETSDRRRFPEWK